MRFDEEPTPEWARPRFVAGLDLGQKADRTAICLGRATFDPRASVADAHKTNRLDVLGLRRYPLRTAYPRIVELVRETMASPALHFDNLGHYPEPLPPPVLLVDATGVGASTVDQFLDAGLACTIIPVTITAGQQAGEGRWNDTAVASWSVPKKDLVHAALTFFESRRLRIAEGMPEADVLLAELESFKVRVTLAGNEQYGAGPVGMEGHREGEHDDLVLAVAMAAWWAGRRVEDHRLVRGPNPARGWRGSQGVFRRR